ncbi:MAG: PIN domain-containing protein [Anaerolineae bacterium]
MIADDLFVDASAWIALADDTDNKHREATTAYLAMLRTYHRLVTTNLVVSEVYIALRNKIGHRAAIGFLEASKSSPRIECVFSTSELESRAERILRRYADQDFSYVDAVSFALMQTRQIKDAFTFDKHFAIMGFNCLPQ